MKDLTPKGSGPPRVPLSLAKVVRYPLGHFDVYFDAAFERSVADQEAFLRRHLL